MNIKRKSLCYSRLFLMRRIGAVKLGMQPFCPRFSPPLISRRHPIANLTSISSGIDTVLFSFGFVSSFVLPVRCISDSSV
jgi:hypothetical protein